MKKSLYFCLGLLPYIMRLLHITAMFLVVSTYAQTGPGGVGNTNGTSNLRIWLKADDIDADGNLNDNPANNARVTTWSDFSGNNNHFNQGTNNRRPVYNTTGTFNAVNFLSTGSNINFMNGTLTGNYRNTSIFFVVNPRNSGNSSSLFDNGSVSLRVEQWSNTNDIGITRYGIADHRSSLTSPYNNNSIISFHKSNNSSSVNIRLNNQSQNLGVGNQNTGLPVDRIGKLSSVHDKASGNFYEVIFFDGRINTTQQTIIENYLSAKYGSIAIQQNIYNEDNAGAGNYDFDVAGIGRISGSDRHEDSQGTGIVRINNPTNLNNNEFLLWGHDNATLAFNSATDLPANIDRKLARTWRVSEVHRTNLNAVDVGAVDMQFDLTGLTGINLANLKLLVDTDNDGQFNDEDPIGPPVNIGGNIYRFNGVTAIANNRRFTLALGTITVVTNRRITYRTNN